MTAFASMPFDFCRSQTPQFFLAPSRSSNATFIGSDRAATATSAGARDRGPYILFFVFSLRAPPCRPSSVTRGRGRIFVKLQKSLQAATTACGLTGTILTTLVERGSPLVFFVFFLLFLVTTKRPFHFLLHWSSRTKPRAPHVMGDQCEISKTSFEENDQGGSSARHWGQPTEYVWRIQSWMHFFAVFFSPNTACRLV